MRFTISSASANPLAPKVMIVDEFGDPLQEKYYEIDSTLQLSCVVRNVAMATSVVYWKHGVDVLNYDVTRGGIRYVFTCNTHINTQTYNQTLTQTYKQPIHAH